MSVKRTFSSAPWERTIGYCRAILMVNQIAVTGTAPVDDDGNELQTFFLEEYSDIYG